MGCAYSALGEKDKAIKSWNEVVGSATHNNRTPGSGGGERRVFENNSQEQHYFIALAKKKLGSKDAADVILLELAANQIQHPMHQAMKATRNLSIQSGCHHATILLYHIISPV